MGLLKQSSYICTVILLGLFHLVPQEKILFGNTQKSIMSVIVYFWSHYTCNFGDFLQCTLPDLDLSYCV